MNKKQKSAVNGWLLVNKPAGITSAGIVNKIKKILSPKKIGHAGTLDPFASGVLPLALGEATKTVRFCVDQKKEYIFTIKWGESTNTLDTEGEVTATSDYIPPEAAVKKIVSNFIGSIKQTPPQYSAIKINGKRAYTLARKGEMVDIPERKITIYSLDIIKTEQGITHFKAECSKGTYIRKLGYDIAKKLGTEGHVSNLIRTRVGKFSLKDAILLDKVKEIGYKALTFKILPVDYILDDIPVYNLTDQQANAIKNGLKVEANMANTFSQTCCLYNNNTLIALAEHENGFLKPKRIIHN